MFRASELKNPYKTKPISSEVILITKLYKECDIDSWVDHYLNWCGFDHIIIVDNESTCCNIEEKFKDNEKVDVVLLYDKSKFLNVQQYYYTRYVNTNNKYTYQFFCDDDEYLWFDKTKYKIINDYLKKLNENDIYQFGVPRTNISYKSSKTPKTRQKPMIDDCKYVSDKYNQETFVDVKPFIHRFLKNTIDHIKFVYPHFINNYLVTLPNNTTFEPNVTGPKAKINISNCDIRLFHYYHRSLDEWEEKLNRTRIDSIENLKYKDQPTDKSINYPENEYTKLLNPFKRK